MSDIVNPGNHPIKGLNECNEISPLQASVNIDEPSPNCPTPIPMSSQKDVSQLPTNGWLEDASTKKVGIGQEAQCDPMQTGQIVDDLRNPKRGVAYRYSKALRGADEAMLDLFRNLVVLDEDGKAHPVPIIWATQERAVAYVLQDNIRKDDSLVVDRIKLPMLAIYSNDIQFDQSRYTYHKAVNYMKTNKPGFTMNEGGIPNSTVMGFSRGIPVDIGYTLYGWTFYMEDMDQIIEQILTKFSPVAYIRVRGVSWETIVSLDSINNNLEIEPGDEKMRVIKFQFQMTAKTYIPQPLIRKKAVLKTKVDILNNTDLEEATEVLGRLEETIKEFEN